MQFPLNFIGLLGQAGPVGAPLEKETPEEIEVPEVEDMAARLEALKD